MFRDLLALRCDTVWTEYWVFDGEIWNYAQKLSYEGSDMAVILQHLSCVRVVGLWSYFGGEYVKFDHRNSLRKVTSSTVMW